MKLDIEKIKDLYINQNLTLKKVAEILNLNMSNISYYLKKYNIKKDKEQIKKNQSENWKNRTEKEKEERNEKFKNTWSKKTKEELEKIKEKKEITCLNKFGYKNPFYEKKIQNEIHQKFTNRTKKRKTKIYRKL